MDEFDATSSTAADPVLPLGYSLRPLDWADLPAVHALENRLFPLDAWPLSFFEEELAQAVPESDGGTRDYRVTTGPKGEADAGEGADAVVGYCGLMCVPPLADVQTIAVAPEAEGRGLGTAMLLWMVAEAARRRATDLLLEVRADNPRAQQLYARHGFEHIHTRAGYYPGDAQQGTGRVDALIMRRHLLV
ncbi:GNAT family N-acetyltransferase [Citricoccus alkalitolerans]|uniref:GNAT family N-acetyltransferase n=1 Tax=Citricoccus alkalitolerans TaxID=246603 RepID=A0ABV8XUU9_9MICC